MTETLSFPVLRPGEIVLNYLEREFLSEHREGTRIPTIEQIASHVNVSVSTVRNVIRRLTEDGRLEAIQGRGTFIKKGPLHSGAPLTLGSNLMVYNASHDQNLNWSETIYFGAVRATTAQPRSISMLPVTQRDALDFEGMQRDLLNLIDHIDLLMLYPLRWEGRKVTEKIHRAYEAAGKPVIWINPPKLNAVSNFVSGDYFEIGSRIGSVWKQAGRRKILFIPHIRLGGSVSNQLYLQGLANGCERDDDPSVDFRVAVASDISEKAGRKILENLSFTPDAVFCSSDIVAAGALEVLRNRGLCIPRDVSFIAGTGLYTTRAAHPELTVVQLPMERMGAEAVRLLVQRHENGNAPAIGLYLPASIHPETTTSPEENALFRAFSSTSSREG